MKRKTNNHTAQGNTLIVLCLSLIIICVSHGCNKTKPATQPAGVDICNNMDSLNAAIAKDTTNGYLYSCRAQLFYIEQNYINALFDIEAAMKIKGNNTDDLLLLSDVYFALGNNNHALQSLMIAKDLDKENYKVPFGLGKHFYLTGQMELAKGYLAQSVEMNPDNTESYNLLGEISLSEGDTAKAIEYLHKAIQFDSKYYPPFIQLATISMNTEPDLAPQYLRSAISIDSTRYEAYLLLGVFMQEKGNFDEALDLYEKTVQLNRNLAIAHYNMGYIYLTEKQQFDSAYISFDAAVAIDSTYIDARYNRAYTLQLMGRKEEALQQYREILQHNPDYILAKERVSEM